MTRFFNLFKKKWEFVKKIQKVILIPVQIIKKNKNVLETKLKAKFKDCLRTIFKKILDEREAERRQRNMILARKLAIFMYKEKYSFTSQLSELKENWKRIFMPQISSNLYIKLDKIVSETKMGSIRDLYLREILYRSVFTYTKLDSPTWKYYKCFLFEHPYIQYFAFINQNLPERQYLFELKYAINFVEKAVMKAVAKKEEKYYDTIYDYYKIFGEKYVNSYIDYTTNYLDAINHYLRKHSGIPNFREYCKNLASYGADIVRFTDHWIDKVNKSNEYQIKCLKSTIKEGVDQSLNLLKKVSDPVKTMDKLPDSLLLSFLRLHPKDEIVKFSSEMIDYRGFIMYMKTVRKQAEKYFSCPINVDCFEYADPDRIKYGPEFGKVMGKGTTNFYDKYGFVDYSLDLFKDTIHSSEENESKTNFAYKDPKNYLDFSGGKVPCFFTKKFVVWILLIITGVSIFLMIRMIVKKIRAKRTKKEERF